MMLDPNSEGVELKWGHFRAKEKKQMKKGPKFKDPVITSQTDPSKEEPE